jgi:hypothetical protein
MFDFEEYDYFYHQTNQGTGEGIIMRILVFKPVKPLGSLLKLFFGIKKGD